MKKNEYHKLKDFFKFYTNPFVEQAEDPEPFKVKIVHTANVCDNIKILAQSQGWNGEKLYKALATALLHDIGRFAQYKKYGTFNDAQSKNHGTLGVGIIKNKGILKNLDKIEQKQITTAVALHNAFCLPPSLNLKTLQLTRLVRDADKLDIYRVMVELYKDILPGKKSFITYNLPDDDQLSQKLIENIENRQLIDTKNVKTLNDMKLLQISWIFDLNFHVSLELVQKRGYITSILSTMPQSMELGRVFEAATNYVEATTNPKVT